MKHQLRISCPHCQHHASIRTSEQLTPLYRVAWVRCTNERCGWRGRLDMELTHTTTPSLTPNPSVHIPLTPQARRSLLAQLLPEAN